MLEIVGAILIAAFTIFALRLALVFLVELLEGW